MRIRESHTSLQLYAFHFGSADFGECTGVLIGVLRTKFVFGAKNLLYHFHNVAVLVAIACQAGDFGCISIEQPVVDARTSYFLRCRVVKEQRTFDVERYFIGGVGTHIRYLLVGLFFSVKGKHHTVAHFEFARQSAAASQEFVVGTCHVHHIGIVGHHLSRMYDVHYRTYGVVKVLIDIAFTEYFTSGIQCALELVNKFLQIGEYRVFIYGLVVTVGHRNLTIERILLTRTGSGTYMFVIVVVFQCNESGVLFRSNLLDGVILITGYIYVFGESLVVHTEYDVGKGVVLVVRLTSCVSLINHQRGFGSEDTHIVNDEVVTVIIGCHIHYAYAEVVVVLFLLNGEEDLVPLVSLRQITCHIGSDILPRITIHRALHGEGEVRAGLISALATRVSHIS